MNRYRLHARKIVGGLAAPTHDETRSLHSPDLAALQREANRLGGKGFTVWIYAGDDRSPVTVHRTAPRTGTGRRR